MGGREWAGWSEGGKWDNCNTIINKYILKKELMLCILESEDSNQCLNESKLAN